MVTVEMGHPNRVLVADQDPSYCSLVKRVLSTNHISVTVTDSTEGVIEALAKKPVDRPDMLIFDPRGFNYPNGIALDIPDVKRLGNIPIFVISEERADNKKVEALDQGAEDYLVKPLNTDNLLARVNRLLNFFWTAGTGRELTLTNGVRVNLTQAVAIDHQGLRIPLTRIESFLIRSYMRRLGHIVSQEQTLTEIWGEEYRDDYHLLHNWVLKVRGKLGPEVLKSVHLRGYLLDGYFYKNPA